MKLCSFCPLPIFSHYFIHQPSSNFSSLLALPPGYNEFVSIMSIAHFFSWFHLPSKQPYSLAPLLLWIRIYSVNCVHCPFFLMISFTIEAAIFSLLLAFMNLCPFCQLPIFLTIALTFQLITYAAILPCLLAFMNLCPSYRSGVGNLFGVESHEHHIFLNVIPWEPYNMFKTKNTSILYIYYNIYIIIIILAASQMQPSKEPHLAREPQVADPWYKWNKFRTIF